MANNDEINRSVLLSLDTKCETTRPVKKTSLGLVLALAVVLLILYGLFSGRLQTSFEQTPYSTGFIVFILAAYAAVHFARLFRKK